LQVQLADLKIAYAALQDEITELKSQKQEDIDNPLTISVSGIYADTHQNLFCTGCYDGPASRRVHLVYKSSHVGLVIYFCPVCKTEFKQTDEVGPAKPFYVR